MERDLLAGFTGDSGGQRLRGQGRPPPSSWPSPTLILGVGSDEDRAGHGRAPKRAQAAASNVVGCPCPSTSRVPFDSPLVSVVVPGHPAAAVPSRDGLGPPPPSLEPVFPSPTIGATRGEQCRCDLSSLCARLMQGLAGDLARARAQVAMLTCENESLRHRLKRAAADETETAAVTPSLSRRLHRAGGLRCRACLVRPATVVLAPREHLCLCARCSDACRFDPAIACWVCRDAADGTGPGATAAAPR